jgi:hypothetical protein
MKDIITDLIDEYIARHKETLDILSRPEWVEIIERGKAEVAEGVESREVCSNWKSPKIP